MDQNVLNDLKLAFACDLYETIKAARKNRDEHVFRHSMIHEGEQMVFASVFPKKDIMEFPNLTDDFVAKLQTFNLLGIITDGESGLDMFYLGGQTKPFTSVEDATELSKVLSDEPLMAFLEMYFKIQGVMMDFRKMNHDEFVTAIESEVFKNTPFSKMQEAQDFLKMTEN